MQLLALWIAIFYLYCWKETIMNEIVIVIIAIVTLIAAVIIYGVISTTMGYEDDVNKNYIPDRLERALGMEVKDKEEAKKE